MQKKRINKNSFFEIQDEGSQIVTILSGARSGMKVLDYCAGKGTKTIALLNKCKDKELFMRMTKFQKVKSS